MSEIHDDSMIRKSENCLETDIDGEVALMHLKSGQFFSLGNTGYHAWKLVGNGIRFGEITASLVEEYDVSLEVCRREVTALFSQLLERSLVEVD